MAGQRTRRATGTARKLKRTRANKVKPAAQTSAGCSVSTLFPGDELFVENERWFQRLVETAKIIAWEADFATWRFTYVGAQAVEILGYPLADWFKDGFWENHIHTEDRSAAIRSCAEGTRHEEDFELEYRMVRADGRTVWFHDLVHVVRDATGPRIIKGFLIDITDRKQAEQALRQSEERMRLALQASQTGTFEIDLESGEAHWNSVEFELLGLKPGDAPPGPETFFRFVHPHDVGRLRNQWKEAIQVGKLAAEFRIVRADGRERWLGAKGGFVTEGENGSDGRNAGRRFLGVNFDITDRRRRESELLVVSDHEQRRIGHDLHDGLGQRLTALEMQCFLLWEDLQTSDLNANRRRLQEQARELGDALRECITVTRSLARGLAPVDLKSDGLAGALNQLAERTSAVSKIQCRFSCRRPIVLHDAQAAGHLYRIAQEAVNNAVKHARPQRIRIDLTRSGRLLRLRVQDDGVGLGASRKAKSGMGVEIMRHRANVMGASLKIDSRPKKGVTITCTLPLKEAAEDE